MKIFSALSFTLLSMISLSTSTAFAQTQVVSNVCGSHVPGSAMLVSQRSGVSTGNLKLAPSGGSSEKKTCETTNAPATNEQGENGTNRCTTCTYSSSGHVTVNCIFIKPK